MRPTQPPLSIRTITDQLAPPKPPAIQNRWPHPNPLKFHLSHLDPTQSQQPLSTIMPSPICPAHHQQQNFLPSPPMVSNTPLTGTTSAAHFANKHPKKSLIEETTATQPHTSFASSYPF
ncbi:hypothetical protein SLA2020_026710 [Shorea laevis]